MFGSFGSSTTGTTSNPFGSFGTQQQQGQQQPQQQQQQQNPPTLTLNTGGVLFGNTQPAAQPGQPSGGGLFGSTTTNPATATTGGAFGAAQPTAGTGAGGLFGTQPGTSGQAGQTGQTGGGLFGMGAQPAAGGGLFGGAAGQQPQPAAGGGMFGSAAAQPTTGGGLFGNTGAQQPAAGGGLFGASTTTQPGLGGGLFGSTTTQPAAGGGLFGNSAQPATGGGLFGSTAAQPGASSTVTGGGPFGQQPKPAGSTFGSTGGLFGSTLGQSTLGSSTLGQSTLGLSALGNPTLGQSTLGVSALGPPPGAQPGRLLSARGSYIPPPSATGDPAAQGAVLQAKIEGIYEAWNPTSPSCRFQHHFYNMVEPSQVHMYGRPSNATNEALWTKAVQENPDPSCLVPVVAVGFDDLQQRVDAQTQVVKMHKERLEELKKRVTNLSERHSLSNNPRLQKTNAQQIQIQHRLLKLVQHLHLLIPALRASSLQPEEEALRGALEGLVADITGTNGRGPVVGVGRMRGKLNELWALLGAVNAARERERGGAIGSSRGWKVVDEEGLKEIAGVLTEQQAGLAHLTKILQKDLRDVAVIEGTEVRDETGKLVTGQSQDGSYLGSSTLRASTLR